MTAADRALDALKAVFTYREQMTALREDLRGLGGSLKSLADSHANLRDRVSRIEGYLGRTGSVVDDAPRLGS